MLQKVMNLDPFDLGCVKKKAELLKILLAAAIS